MPVFVVCFVFVCVCVLNGEHASGGEGSLMEPWILLTGCAVCVAVGSSGVPNERFLGHPNPVAQLQWRVSERFRLQGSKS